MSEPGYLSRPEIETGQLEQLRTLLAELIPGNRFYARKLNDAGITFDVASLTDFSARFPFTTKSEIAVDQKATPPFGTNLTYPLERYTRYHQTSGTAGAPLRWLDTPESWDGLVESWTQILQFAGVTPADRLYFAFSFGPFIGFWLAFESAARLGCLCVPGGGLSSTARLRAILDNEMTVVCCTPTYALRLAEAAAQEGISLSRSKVRRLIVAGEPGGSVPSVRARLEEVWPGAQVFDHHGMTEVGPVTYQCPARPGTLHVLESAYYAEVINPKTAEKTPAGAAGELVLTTLGRLGSPLLRYRTGDMVKTGVGRCACGGEELALEGGILGRTDDMVVIRGVNVYPAAVEELVRGCGGIAEYRVEVRHENALHELSVEIESAAGDAAQKQLAQKLQNIFESALALKVPVTVVPAGTLPRFEMKAKRWVVKEA